MWVITRRGHDDDDDEEGDGAAANRLLIGRRYQIHASGWVKSRPSYGKKVRAAKVKKSI